MHRKKLIAIYTIIICIIFGTAACSTNKSLHKKQNVKIENNNPPRGKNIGYQQQVNKESKLPIKPPVTPLKPLVKYEVVARFNTKLLDSSKNRINNIYNASKKINNYVLKPDEVFSFNSVVGKREYRKGYKMAKILVNGEREEGLGGGICLLSSTIYKAAEKLGLEIIERHSHSDEVYYVSLGQDAVVNYGNKDLRFKNIKKYSIKFKIRIKRSRLYISILKIK